MIKLVDDSNILNLFDYYEFINVLLYAINESENFTLYKEHMIKQIKDPTRELSPGNRLMIRFGFTMLTEEPKFLRNIKLSSSTVVKVMKLCLTE